MNNFTSYFQTVLHAAFSLYFNQESQYTSLREIPIPEKDELAAVTGKEIIWEERIVLLLALMPHVQPQSLDLFFIQNKDLDRPYTIFGGWKGSSHNGFLPTGDTAAFLLSVDDPQGRVMAMHLFSEEHWFYKENVLKLEGHGQGEPYLSGKLIVSEEFLVKATSNESYRPGYDRDFPARRMETKLEWDDLVVPYHLWESLNDISVWLEHGQEIRQRWNLDRLIKPGYRCLLYGPPGTGKTLAACLLGKKHGKEVYRIDLSMIVSKYIGETEKNLAKIFDRAMHQNWILFFDEADALFGKRSDANSSNDRHANQEVAYMLQRIEDFPGMIVLATNLKDNLDEAFFRRFQSILNFPMPDQPLRLKLWQQMIPGEWLEAANTDILNSASQHKLSGGSMVNVIQYCALHLYRAERPILTEDILRTAINNELDKEGILVNK
ncbi:ATP-binding protein [Flavobacterium sp. DGU11]|uniref:ATP-binding protein n=1 Tax=Flavobacterium arundinis TaxID=3139143 RepID=A0ABU9HRL2_9FLAO